MVGEKVGGVVVGVGGVSFEHLSVKMDEILVLDDV